MQDYNDAAHPDIETEVPDAMVLIPFPEKNEELVTVQRPKPPAWLRCSGEVVERDVENMSHCFLCASRLHQRRMTSVVTFTSTHCSLREGSMDVVSCPKCNISMKQDGSALGRVEMIHESIFAEHLSMMVAGGCSFTSYVAHKARMYQVSGQSHRFVHKESLIIAFEFYTR